MQIHRVNMNLGLLELVNGNTAAAQTYFGKAGGAKDAGEALGTLYMMQEISTKRLTHLVLSNQTTRQLLKS